VTYTEKFGTGTLVCCYCDIGNGMAMFAVTSALDIEVMLETEGWMVVGLGR
jgi:hypothetical protein